MTDKKDTDKQSPKEAASKNMAKNMAKSTIKKTSAASSDIKKTANEAAKKIVKKEPAVTHDAAKIKATTTVAATKKASASTKVNKAATAATAKAAASKDSDLKAAAKKISEVDKKAANNAIKSRKSVEDLKSRAHEAKQRAQKKILEESYVSDKPTDPLERLANTFDSSAKRWEMVVYPSLFAFVLLAGYGFFLIYRLTHDIAVLSQSVTHMAVIVSDVMPRMSNDLTKMTGSIDNMTDNVEGMSADIGGMTTEIISMSGQMNALTPISKNIQGMTHSMDNMNRSVYGMQRDMSGMNRTISSGPLGMMGDVMPFGSGDNVPPPIHRTTPIWPAQNWTPYYQPNYKVGPQYGASKSPVRPQVKKKTTGEEKSVEDKKNTVQNSLKRKVIVPDATPVSPKESAHKDNTITQGQ